MDVDCERIQDSVSEFVTAPERYSSGDVLREVREHLRACGPCRSLVEHDLEGARPEVLATLLRG